MGGGREEQASGGDRLRAGDVDDGHAGSIRRARMANSRDQKGDTRDQTAHTRDWKAHTRDWGRNSGGSRESTAGRGGLEPGEEAGEGTGAHGDLDRLLRGGLAPQDDRAFGDGVRLRCRKDRDGPRSPCWPAGKPGPGRCASSTPGTRRTRRPRSGPAPDASWTAPRPGRHRSATLTPPPRRIRTHRNEYQATTTARMVRAPRSPTAISTGPAPARFPGLRPTDRPRGAGRLP